MDKEKGKVKSEKGTAKMTAEQKACLAAFKSLNEDVERAKEINNCSEYVLGELCKSCTNVKECCGKSFNCRMSAIAAVAVGMILESKGGAK